MSERWLRAFGLARDPFTKEIPTSDAYETRDLKEVRARLDFLSRAGGVGLVTAQPGFGKTFALRAWTDGVPRDVDVRYACLSTVTCLEFYRQLCDVLGIEPSYRKTDMFKRVQAHLREQAVERRVRVVLALDEAQYLSGDVLRDLTMLTNFDMDSRSCVAVVLVGQTDAADHLRRGTNEALRQRVVVSYELGGVTEDEARGYVSSMLRAAGGSPSVVSDAAVTAANGIAGGSVRRLGSILSAAIRIAAQEGRDQVDAEMVRSASEEVYLT